MYSTNQKRELLNALYALEPKIPEINSPEDAVMQFLKYRKRRVEHFVSLSLNNKNEVIRRHELSRGTADQCAMYIQEVLKATLRCDGSAIILGHNHPGGDPTPSREDIDLTTRLRDAANLVGLRLLDHIVVARFGHYSLKENGHL